MSKTKKKLLILIPLFIFLDQLSKNWMLSYVFDSLRIIEINRPITKAGRTIVVKLMPEARIAVISLSSEN